jgi:hypothetical protein
LARARRHDIASLNIQKRVIAPKEIASSIPLFVSEKAPSSPVSPSLSMAVTPLGKSATGRRHGGE